MAELAVSCRRVEHVMGTAVSVALSEPAPATVFDRVFAWLRRVDALFSTYRADSDVSRLGRGEVTLEDCHPSVRRVIGLCGWLAEATGGYFDAHATGVPDPSGVVKGWSVEVASQMLRAAGAGGHCVNAGGDVRCRGGSGRAGVAGRCRRPAPAGAGAGGRGRDVAVATSGTTERGFHVTDPHTGTPARELAAVTVVGPSLTVADAFATAAVAMGVRARPWLAGLPGYSAFVVDSAGGVWWSEGFARVAPDLPVAAARTME